MDKLLRSLNKDLISERILKIIDIVGYRRDRTSFYPISSSLSKTSVFYPKVLVSISRLIQGLPKSNLILSKVKQHSNPIIYYSIIENQLNKKYFNLKNIKETEIKLKIPFGDLKIFLEKEYLIGLSVKEGLNLRWYRMFNPRDGFKRISWREYNSKYLSITKVDLSNVYNWRIEPFGYIIKMNYYYYYLFPSNPVAWLNKSTVDRILSVIRKKGKETGWFFFPIFGRSYLVKTHKLNLKPSMPYLKANRINIDFNKYVEKIANRITSKENIKNLIKKVVLKGVNRKYVINL